MQVASPVKYLANTLCDQGVVDESECCITRRNRHCKHPLSWVCQPRIPTATTAGLAGCPPRQPTRRQISPVPPDWGRRIGAPQTATRAAGAGESADRVYGGY